MHVHQHHTIVDGNQTNHIRRPHIPLTRHQVTHPPGNHRHYSSHQTHLWTDDDDDDDACDQFFVTSHMHHIILKKCRQSNDGHPPMMVTPQ